MRDDELRDLERRASGGDPGARRSLDAAWARLGRGWSGETLPDRLRRGFESPFYLWDTLRGFAVEMVRVPAGELAVVIRDLHLAELLGQSSVVVTREEKHAIARPFWIARAPVSREEYSTHRHVGISGEDAGPIVVTHEAAVAFAASVGLELPTEAQWDKGAVETLRGRSLLRADIAEWCVDDYLEPALGGQAASIAGKVVRHLWQGLPYRDVQSHAAIRLVLVEGGA